MLRQQHEIMRRIANASSVIDLGLRLEDIDGLATRSHRKGQAYDI